MSTETLLWLESTGFFLACLWGMVTEVDDVLLLPQNTSVKLVSSGGVLYSSSLSSSLGKGMAKRGMFTYEPFPSVVWSCMFGTRCSRHPCTGPYTWQYISVRRKAIRLEWFSPRFVFVPTLQLDRDREKQGHCSEVYSFCICGVCSPQSNNVGFFFFMKCL